MTPRLQFALALFAATAFTTGCAQTKAATQKPQETKAPTAPAKLQQIVPNAKWTIGQNSAQLLIDVHVQKDLQLSTETKGELQKVYGAFNEKYNSITKAVTDRDALEAAMDAALLTEANGAVSKLSSGQIERLNQLGLQAMELEAFRLADVRTKLAVTADQAAAFDKAFAEIDAKEDAYNNELGERMSKLADPGPSATADQLAALKKAQNGILDDLRPQAQACEDLRKSDMKVFLGQLSAEQRATWKSMVGAPLQG